MARLVLPAVLTHAEAAGCCVMLARTLRADGEPQAVVDAGALERFDSSALAVLLECRRDALALGKGFEVRGLPERLRSLASLYGVSELLPG